MQSIAFNITISSPVHHLEQPTSYQRVRANLLSAMCTVVRKGFYFFIFLQYSIFLFGPSPWIDCLFGKLLMACIKDAGQISRRCPFLELFFIFLFFRGNGKIWHSTQTQLFSRPALQESETECVYTGRRWWTHTFPPIDQQSRHATPFRSRGSELCITGRLKNTYVILYVFVRLPA